MKYVIASSKFAEGMTEKVQDYLDKGYILKGDTFVTTVTLYKSVEYYYNQVLIKNDEKELKIVE